MHQGNGIIVPKGLIPVQFLIRKYTDWFIPGPGLGLEGIVENVLVLNADGSVAYETGPFRNLITDSGLNMAMTRIIADCFSWCRVGTGTAPAAVTDTVLQAQAGSTNALLTGAGNTGTTAPSVTQHEILRTFDFALGALSGTFGELGFSFSGTATDVLFARTQIMSGGVATTATVTASQQLRVVYRLRVNFAPAAHTPLTVDIPGWGPTPGVHAMQSLGLGTPIVTIDTTGTSSPHPRMEPSGAGPAGAGGFVSVTSTALAAVGSAMDRSGWGRTRTLAAYTAGTFFRDHHLDFPLAEANSSALWSCGVGSLGASTQVYAMVFDAARAKVNTHTLRLTFRISIARA